MQKTSSLKTIRFLLITISICLSLNACGKQKPTESHISEMPQVKVVPVELRQLNKNITLPGELRAYQDVPVHAKVEGYISWIGVDRGSAVKKGQKMITIFCPELQAKVKEAEAKVSSTQASYRQSQSALQSEISKQLESKAKLDADTLTFQRLQKAATTPGAIAQNEVDVAEKTVEADQERLESIKASVAAAKALVVSEKNNVLAAINVLNSLRDMSSYLNIEAPFDGVITERNVHNGSIVSVDAARRDLPLVRIQQKSLLRLVVPVPEDCTAGLAVGSKVPFTVPAFLGKTFYGTIARLGFALKTDTRTMPVEMDVPNDNGELEPGMFATVIWHVTRPYKTLFVPSSAAGGDLKGIFVIKIKDGVAERVNVTRGQTMENLVEILGQLQAGDQVALKASDELQSGTHVQASTATIADIKQASQQTVSAGE